MKNSGIPRIITRKDVAGNYVVPCFWSYVTGIIGPYIWQLWYANMGVEVSLHGPGWPSSRDRQWPTFSSITAQWKTVKITMFEKSSIDTNQFYECFDIYLFHRIQVSRLLWSLSRLILNAKFDHFPSDHRMSMRPLRTSKKHATVDLLEYRI